MNRLRQLIHEIHRRSLWQVLGIYVVGGWIAYQVVQSLTEGLGLPKWFPAFAVMLLIIGLPIVMATAFVQEGVSGRNGGDADRAAPAAPPGAGLFTWRNALGGGVLALALWGVVATGWVLLGGRIGGDSSTDEAPASIEQSIAVLPFEDLSPEGDQQYFVEGLSEEIINALTQIADLKVSARTSAFAFRDSDLDIRTIADSLGVANVLEGSVRKSGDQIRITAQLIDAESGFHLWSDTYDRQLDDIFAVQDEIAGAIRQALGVTLGGENWGERGRTADVEAYDLYLRGNDYFNRGLGDPSVVIAADMYERAVTLDPAFVLGHAALAKAHSRAAFQGLDRPDERMDRAREAAETALRLDEEHPAALAANGWYHYWALGDFVSALEWFEPALEGFPNDSELLLGVGLTERRLARWDDALRHLRLSHELDPLSNEKAIEVGISYAFQHDYVEAVGYFETAVALAPDQYRSYAHLTEALIGRDGTLDGAARQTLRRGGDAVGRSEFVQRMLSGQPPGIARRLMLDVFPTELRELERESLTEVQAAYYFGLLAEQRGREGLTASERAFADSVLTVTESQPARGVAYARLGQRAEALRALETPQEMMNLNARSYQDRVITEAYGYLLLGEQDAAVERLDHALSVPGAVSIGIIQVDPRWSSLRDHPGFDLLMDKYGTR